jgi:hypothetical protein
MSQGIPCVAILNKNQKMSLFAFAKSENWRVEQVLPEMVGTCGKE